MGGAMTWVSERHLVAAISNAGGFGVIACGSMSPELLSRGDRRDRGADRRPFGVNLITMHPQLHELVEVCLAQQGRACRAGRRHAAGRRACAHQAGRGQGDRASRRRWCIARKLVRSGADAHRHRGHGGGRPYRPGLDRVLAQEILPHIREVPVFVAGGIGRGEAILAYLEMGASGCQLGTRFVCATKSIAHPNFKQAFIRAAARDAVPSVQLDPRFPVIPVRALVNDGDGALPEIQREMIDRFDRGELTQKEAQLEIEHFWAGALRRAVIDGDVENGSLMAGQSVGMVTREQTTRGNPRRAGRSGGRRRWLGAGRAAPDRAARGSRLDAAAA